MYIIPEKVHLILFSSIMPRDWIICSSDILCKEHLREHKIDKLTYITLTSSIHRTFYCTVVRAVKIESIHLLKLHFTFEKKVSLHNKYNTIMKTNDHKCQSHNSKTNSKWTFFPSTFFTNCFLHPGNALRVFAYQTKINYCNNRNHLLPLPLN